MADTPEGLFKKRIQREIKRICSERGIKHKLIWNAGASYGVARLDADGPVAGWPVVLEVKRPDGKGKGLTGRQKLSMREYREAGAIAFAIVDEASLQDFLLWLSVVRPRPFL